MRPLLLCSLLLACAPEDKPTSTSSATDTSSATTEDTTSDATGPGSSTSATSGTSTTGSTSDATSTTSSPVACEALDEPTCLAEPGCAAHHGAPRIMQNGLVCADVKNQQFLACGAAGPPCPPVVLTVCPIGQPGVAFDVASGCVPPGYEVCMDGPAPECP